MNKSKKKRVNPLAFAFADLNEVYQDSTNKDVTTRIHGRKIPARRTLD